LCARSPSKRGVVDVIDERALAVDLDDRQPFAVPGLERRIAGDVDLPKRDAAVSEHRPGSLAEVAAGRVEEDDVRYG
jgi:hypothetical protein